MFAVTRFRYIKVQFLIFYYYWGEEYRSLYRLLRQVRYYRGSTVVILLFKQTCAVFFIEHCLLFCLFCTQQTRRNQLLAKTKIPQKHKIQLKWLTSSLAACWGIESDVSSVPVLPNHMPNKSNIIYLPTKNYNIILYSLLKGDVNVSQYFKETSLPLLYGDTAPSLWNFSSEFYGELHPVSTASYRLFEWAAKRTLCLNRTKPLKMPKTRISGLVNLVVYHLHWQTGRFSVSANVEKNSQD